MSVAHRSLDSSRSVTGSPEGLVQAHARRPARFAPRWRNGDVLVAMLVLWVASAVRVVGAGVRHEVFGTEATLAFICLVFVPCVFFRAWAGDRGRSHGSSPQGRPALRLVGGAVPPASTRRPTTSL